MNILFENYLELSIVQIRNIEVLLHIAIRYTAFISVNLEVI